MFLKILLPVKFKMADIVLKQTYFIGRIIEMCFTVLLLLIYCAGTFLLVLLMDTISLKQQLPVISYLAGIEISIFII